MRERKRVDGRKSIYTCRIYLCRVPLHMTDSFCRVSVEFPVNKFHRAILIGTAN